MSLFSLFFRLFLLLLVWPGYPAQNENDMVPYWQTRTGLVRLIIAMELAEDGSQWLSELPEPVITPETTTIVYRAAFIDCQPNSRFCTLSGNNQYTYMISRARRSYIFSFIVLAVMFYCHSEFCLANLLFPYGVIAANVASFLLLYWLPETIRFNIDRRNLVSRLYEDQHQLIGKVYSQLFIAFITQQLHQSLPSLKAIEYCTETECDKPYARYSGTQWGIYEPFLKQSFSVNRADYDQWEILIAWLSRQ